MGYNMPRVNPTNAHKAVVAERIFSGEKFFA
jgi:hypothetical protein